MKVLITGAYGFLGLYFSAVYIEAGHEVTGIDNLSSIYAAERYLTSNPRGFGFADFAAVDAGTYFAEANDTFDLAFHFAAPVGGREKIDGDPLFNADSLRLDSSFFRWAVNHTPTAVYPSSSAVYPVNYQTLDRPQWLREEMVDPASTVWGAPDQMYGFTKLAGEYLASKAAGYGLDSLCIRPFSGYGVNQSLEYPIPSIARRVAKREDPLTIWGSGIQRRDFIYVRDLVTATIARLGAGIKGYQTLNIGSGVGISFMAAARIMAELAGYSPLIDTDGSKPQGVAVRVADPTQMRKFFTPTVSLKDGLALVLEEQTRALALAH